jgi:hypothetical protein
VVSEIRQKVYQVKRRKIVFTPLGIIPDALKTVDWFLKRYESKRIPFDGEMEANIKDGVR